MTGREVAQQIAEEGMTLGSSFSKISVGFVAVSLVLVCAVGFSQVKTATIPDAQIEANVLKALASAPQLAEQAITTTTVYGVVTLSGTVQDEPSRDTAEHLVANAAGVQKVIDQLTIGPVPSTGPVDGQHPGVAGSNPGLRPDDMPPGQTPQNGAAPPQGNGSQQAGTYPQGGQYPPPGQYPQGGQYPPSGQYPPAGAPNGQAYGQPYGQPPSGYQPQRPFVAQKGGDAVVVPSGSLLRVRINQGMDSKHTVAGTAFDGVVLSDVIAGGSIAIPRGATIRGTVVESHKAGEFKGKGELKLQITQVELGGRAYPVVTDFWWHQGADKTGNTVGNTVGLGAMGALIGAVAGGGVGAAVGAGVGGVAGLGVSSATGRGEAVLPPEAVVSFHLTQPVDVTTVSQAELNRLSSGVPAGAQSQMRRRYGYPPPPPPPYYGPGYYPY
jgi:hypothetical protein